MWNELGKLASHLQRRWCSGIHRWYLVEEVGEPHKLCLVGEISAPDGVAHHLVAYRHFLGERFLRVVHERTSHVEVLAKGIVEVESEQRLSLGAIGGLVFECHAHARSGIDDALVGDGDDTHAVIHGIVAVLGERDTSGSNRHRPTRHIHGVEPDL